MTRINTNVSSLIAQNSLQQQTNTLNTALERLSTGLRINSGKDDPAGLIASENLRAEKSALNAAIGNAERANQVVNIAEGGLNEVSSLLNELEGIVGESANESGLSDEEKEANQLQIDSILSSIDRLAASTTFQGEKLLDGTQAFDHNNSSSDITDVKINKAKLPSGANLTVDATVNTQATQGAVFVNTNVDGSGGANDALNADTTFEIVGPKGTQQLTFDSGTAVGDIKTAINQFSEVTGVEAEDDPGGQAGSLRVFTTEYGSDQSVSMEVINSGGDSVLSTSAGDGSGSGTSAEDSGTDVDATINGQSATGDGLAASINTSSLDLELTVDSGVTDGTDLAAFDITGGGASFQLAPEIGKTGSEALGIQAVTSGQLGDGTNTLSALRSGGDLAVTNDSANLSAAQDAVRGAIKDVSQLRGRLGAFQAQTVETSIRANQVTLENTSAAESQIRDADFAKETARLTRAQTLQQAAQSVLQTANARPQSVLSLLGG